MYKSLKIIERNQAGELTNVYPSYPLDDSIEEQASTILDSLFVMSELDELHPESNYFLTIDGVLVKDWEWWLQLYTTDGISMIEDFVSRKLWLSEFLN